MAEFDFSVGKKFAVMALGFSGVDDILSMPSNEREWALVGLATRPSKKIRAHHDFKRIRELAEEIAVRRLNDALSGGEQSPEWKGLLSLWLSSRSRKPGREEINDATRLVVQAAINGCIEKNPNRFMKQIYGEVAGYLGMGDENIRKLDPMAGQRLRHFRKTGKIIR